MHLRRAAAQGELIETRRPWVLHHLLAIHDLAIHDLSIHVLSVHILRSGNVRRDVLLESSVWAQARVGVIESEQGIHLAHYLDNLCVGQHATPFGMAR